jgi:transposase
MVFNARDGKITINIPYKVPVMEAKVDTARQLHVGFYHEEGKPKGKDGKDLSDVGKDFFIHVQVPLGGGVDKYRHFKIPVNNVVEHLKQLAIARSRAELRKNCCMTRGLKTGIQKQREQFRTDANTVSRARDLFVQDNNHLWSKSIVEFAQRWHCGTIKVYLSKDLQFLYGTWPFSQLTDFIEYKGKKCGVNVEKITSEGTEKFLEFFKDKEEEE